ncbi:MAG: hypothetical protein WC438_02755 [Candidatus Pacearchaeota archaeon]
MEKQCEDRTNRISELLIKILCKENELSSRERIAFEDKAYSEYHRLVDWQKSLDKREIKWAQLFDEAYQKEILEEQNYLTN